MPKENKKASSFLKGLPERGPRGNKCPTYMIWPNIPQILEKRCTFKTPTSGENMGAEDRYNDD